MSKQHLGSIKLKNKYEIYKSAGGYVCESENKNRERYSRLISYRDVERIHKLFRNKTVTVKEAQEFVESILDKLDTTYWGGYKLYYYVQSVLLILVVTNRAIREKDGNTSYYTVLP